MPGGIRISWYVSECVIEFVKCDFTIALFLFLVKMGETFILLDKSPCHHTFWCSSSLAVTVNK